MEKLIPSGGTVLIILGVLLAVSVFYRLCTQAVEQRDILRRFDALLMIRHALDNIERPCKDKHTGNIDHNFDNGGFFRVRETTPGERRRHGAKHIAFIKIVHSDGRTGTATVIIGVGGVILGLGSILFTSIKLENAEPGPGHVNSERRNDALRTEIGERIEKLIAISQTNY